MKIKKKTFVDTNVWLYLLGSKELNYKLQISGVEKIGDRKRHLFEYPGRQRNPFQLVEWQEARPQEIE